MEQRCVGKVAAVHWNVVCTVVIDTMVGIPCEKEKRRKGGAKGTKGETARKREKKGNME